MQGQGKLLGAIAFGGLLLSGPANSALLKTQTVKCDVNVKEECVTTFHKMRMILREHSSQATRILHDNLASTNAAIEPGQKAFTLSRAGNTIKITYQCDYSPREDTFLTKRKECKEDAKEVMNAVTSVEGLK